MEEDSLSKKKNKSNMFTSLVAGGGAGGLTAFLCAPLDVVKVRMQIQGSMGITKYSGNILRTLRNIHLEEGVPGLFKGVGPAMLTVPVFWSVYWPMYDGMKRYLDESKTFSSPHMANLVSAVIAGGVGDIITNPFWVTRTRIQAHILHMNPAPKIGMIKMMRSIYKEEGFFALYKGLGASILGLSHVAIQFPLYEYLKKLAQGDKKRDLHWWEITFSSISAKLVASCITYPHEVLRARMQDAKNPSGTNISLRQVLVTAIQREGVLSLWTGVHINFIRVIPATSSFFLAYEYISRYLHRLE